MFIEGLWFEVALIFFLILANGFFAASEIAIIATRKTRIEGEEAVTWKPEVIEVDPPPVSKELQTCDRASKITSSPDWGRNMTCRLQV